jgi:peptidoglycan/LPS O-acetylase OafA/YrhL
MQDKERIFGLDLMRALAILFVLFAHTSFLLPFSPEKQYMCLQYFGFMGVEIFFVLSGYLIGKILIRLYTNNKVNFKTTFYFWIRRWFRTLPTYYLALILSAGIFYFSNKIFVFSDPSYLFYFIFSQNLFSVHPEFFLIAWSLSVEEWFYLLMPLWFMLIYRIINRGKNYLIVAIVSFIFSILLIRMVGVYLNDPEWESGIRRVVIFRLDAIMIGVLGAYLHLNYQQKWYQIRKIVLWLGLSSFFIITIIHYNYVLLDEKGANFFIRTIFFTLVSISIAFFLPSLSVWKNPGRGIIPKIIIYISKISYSLYLFHLIVLFIVLTIGNKISPDANILKFIAAWIFCIAFSAFIHLKFELPLMNKRDKYRL